MGTSERDWKRRLLARAARSGLTAPRSGRGADGPASPPETSGPAEAPRTAEDPGTVEAPRAAGDPGAAAGSGTHRLHPPAAAPDGWPPDAADLLLELLMRFRTLAVHASRIDLLRQMDEVTDRTAGDGPGSGTRFALDVREEFEARAHLRALVRAIAAHPAPGTALASLRTALRDLAPGDRALPWLELAVLGVTGTAPLDPGPSLELIRALRLIGELPEPARLVRYVPRDVPGTGLLTGGETLPEILVRLSDRRAGRDPAPLLRFLTAFADGTGPAAGDPRAERFAPLRELLARYAGRPGPAVAEESGAAGPQRLIVQIRVTAVDPEHIEDGHYELHGAYYLQPAAGGPLRRLGSLPTSVPLRRSELTDEGSARLSTWAELAREVRGAGAAGGVRVEFLLPTSLLGHRAELWSAGASRTPLGHLHPVVVRSLERYSDVWLDPAPWRSRWARLCDDDPHADPLGRIAWAPLAGSGGSEGSGGSGGAGGRGRSAAAELTDWLTGRPEVACLGLPVSYDRLAADLRHAVHDALFMEGVPVMVWRRDSGDPDELVGALRGHPPARLRDLPESVHHCRKHGRTAGDADVRNNITLLWDDPDCVDTDQDMPFAGMA